MIDNCRISLNKSKQLVQQSWLFLSNCLDQFHLHIHPKCIHLLLALLPPLTSLHVDEIAPIPVDAELIVFEATAFFCFVFGVDLVVFSELLQSMGKFASFLVWTVPLLHKLFAELRLEFVWFGINWFLEIILGGVGVALFVGPGVLGLGIVLVTLMTKHFLLACLD